MAGKLSIGQAWADAAAFLRRERRILAPVVLGLIAVPAVVLDMIQPRVPQGELPALGPLWIVVLLMGLVMLIGQMVIALLAAGRSDTPRAAIHHAGRRLPALIGAGLLILLPVLALFVLAGAFGGLAQAGGGLQPANAGRAGIALLGIVLLIGLILFIGVRLLPLVAVVAFRDDGPLAAIKHSFRLTRGHFWKLLGFTLLVAIAFGAVAIAVAAVIGSLVTLALGPPDMWTVSKLLIALCGGLLQAAFVSVYTAMIASITLQLEGGTISGT